MFNIIFIALFVSMLFNSVWYGVSSIVDVLKSKKRKEIITNG